LSFEDDEAESPRRVTTAPLPLLPLLYKGRSGSMIIDSSRSSRFLLVFVLTLSASVFSLVRNRPLGYLGGLADTWFTLGLNIAAYGTFGEEDQPTVYKPPGYPLFIAAVVAPVVGVEREVVFPHRLLPISSDLALLDTSYDLGYLERAAAAVYAAQCVVLAAASALLFLWLSERLAPSVSFGAGLLFGLNPYTIIHTSLLHYAVLHLCLIILSTYVLQLALDRSEWSGGLLFLSGACWGLTTLVRPVTLILPPFLLLAFLLRARWLRALKGFGMVMAGMVLVIAPYTVRNYRLAHRFIPVNAQAWRNIWGATVLEVPIEPNHFRWKEVRRLIMNLEAGVAGKSSIWGWEPYSVGADLLLEDTFRKEALKNLREHPQTYLRNVLGSFLTISLDINSAVIKVFQHIQRPGLTTRFLKFWFWPGDPQDFESPTASEAFSILIGILTFFAAGGIVLSIRNRDPFMLLPGAIYLCISVAHSITWMDLMYYYVKLPFMFVFGFYFVNSLGPHALKLPPLKNTVLAPTAVLVALGAFTFWLTALVIWTPHS
jgi:hypothetical protein